MGQIQTYPAITNANLTTSDQLVVNDASGPNTTKNITFGELDNRWVSKEGDSTINGDLTVDAIIGNGAGLTGVVSAGPGGSSSTGSLSLICNSDGSTPAAIISILSQGTEWGRFDSGNLGLGELNPDSEGINGVIVELSGTDVPAIQMTHTDGGSTANLGLLQFSRSNTDTLVAIRAQSDGATDAGKLHIETQATGGALATAITFDSKKNIGVATQTFDGTVEGYITMLNGTEPSGVTANQIYIGAKDATSTTLSTLSLYTEDPPTAGAPTLSHKVKIWWNGVEYWLGLDSV